MNRVEIDEAIRRAEVMVQIAFGRFVESTDDEMAAALAHSDAMDAKLIALRAAKARGETHVEE